MLLLYGDNTNPPHPHHALFNRFKFGLLNFTSLLNTYTTELVHCNSNLSNGFKSDLLGWGGFAWSPLTLCYHYNMADNSLAQDEGGPSKGVFNHNILFSYTDLRLCNAINGMCAYAHK